MRKGSKQHEDELQKTIEKLTEEGYRVINLQGQSPDAIATKEGKIIAVEVLGKSWRYHPKTTSKELHSGWTHLGKIKEYSMFDDVKIIEFVRNGEGFDNGKTEEAILNFLRTNKEGMRANVIWEKLTFFLSRQRVYQVLTKLEEEGKTKSELYADGRHRRYKKWFPA